MRLHARITLLTAAVCCSLTLSAAQGVSVSRTQEQAEEPSVITTFDEAKNETEVKLRAMTVAKTPATELILGFSASYATRSPARPPEVLDIVIVADSPEGFRFPDVGGLSIVADGRLLPMVTMIRTVKKKDEGGYIEGMASRMRREWFALVADAKTVEMRLQDVDFALDATHLKSIRDFAKVIYPEGAAPPGPEGGASGARARRGGEGGEPRRFDPPPDGVSGYALGMGRFAILSATDAGAERNRAIAKLAGEGKYDEASRLAEANLKQAEQEVGKESVEVAVALNNMAWLSRARGDLIAAESTYKRAGAILEKVLGPADPNVASVLFNLSWLLIERGDAPGAEPYIERALSIFADAFGWESPHVGMSLNVLALVYADRMDFKNAEGLYLDALRLLENYLGKEHLRVGSVLDNLGLLYEQHGFPHIGLPLTQRAVKIFEKVRGPEHPDVATSLNNLAIQYYEIGDAARALQLYTRALNIREKFFGADSPDVAQSLQNLAMLLAEVGRVAEALTAESRVQEIRERNLSRMLTVGSEAQKQRYARTLRVETNSALSLHLQLAPESRQAAELALTTLLRRKGRVLDAMIEQYGALNRSRDRRDQELRGRLAEARARLAALRHKTAGPADAARPRGATAQLKSEIERLEAQAGGHSVAAEEPLTLAQVQRAIPADAALVEFVLYVHDFPMRQKSPDEPLERARYAAYVLRREGPPQWVELGLAEPIDDKVEQLRGALRHPSRVDVKALARSLDEKVMLPVRGLLGRTRRIFISPDGMLNLIPFEALLDERGSYLVEHYSFGYLTSGRDLLRLGRRVTSRQGPVLIADPLFDRGGRVNHQDGGRDTAVSRGREFDRLPGTAAEAKALGRLLKGAAILTGADATESALKRLTGPRILHVATHGFFLPDPPPEPLMVHGSNLLEARERARRVAAGEESPLLRSGLALAGANLLDGGSGEDGILTALEASGLDLWGTQLVVLSACETRLGEVRVGEGVYGLSRALTQAGAESQVMSLWKVDDEAAKDFMLSYYKRLGAGEGRAAALRGVQLGMLATRDRQHPYFWAAFVALGDWRPLEGGAADSSHAARDTRAAAHPRRSRPGRTER